MRPMSRRAALATLSGLGLAATAPIPSLALAAPKPRKPAHQPGYATHPAALAFAEAVSERQGLPLSWLRRQLGHARRVEAVRQLIMPPPAGVAKNGAAYRARFVEPQRVAAGAAFWRANEAALAEAEARWGVPPEIVVGIVGVETYYGRITGNFRVLDALATLAFDFPPGRRDRSAFFADELEAFFVWCSREGLDPQVPKGSYAGAMGLPQFMPSSVLRWALDFDGDDHIDLRTSPRDVVGSVAHYLASFGWERELPTHFEVAPPPEGETRNTLLAPDIVPTFSAQQMLDAGARLPDSARQHEGPLALVQLENGGAPPSYIAGTRNFYVVTRYNWSSYYALAVIELGAAVRDSVKASPR
jgi:membrane-bound lytic murein transglycosylase B